MKKFYTILLLFLVSISLQAQWGEIMVGIDGLTCSMCSKGTESSLKKLDFIETIKMDLNKNIALITVKKDARVRVADIAKKITDAGFSVRFIQATYTFSNKVVSEENYLLLGGTKVRVIQADNNILDGKTMVQFIDKEFLPKKSYKTIEHLLSKYLPYNPNDRIYNVRIITTPLT